MEPQSEYLDDRVLTVPLFPLPNVILFPGAVLPLHIFEERYKAMMADAVAGDRLIAMALLSPGWEKDYYGKPAIEPIVCVGHIARWERLDDGKYNLLLHGQTRARIVEEEKSSPYRIARAQPLRDVGGSETALSEYRRRLMEMFRSEPLVSLPLSEQFRRILDSAIPTSEVADLIAFHAFDQLPLKQSLLAELDVQKRVQRVILALEAALPMMELAHRGASEIGHYN